ncbi:MAG: hypothetical protein ACOC44_07045 [Promethearchaeia archaeon]
MSAKKWFFKPIINEIIDILVKNKGEVLDRRLEELLRKEYPFINPLQLEEMFMKMESMGIISVFRISRRKKMIVLNKRTKALKKEVLEDLI